jgi:Flp pilus assembly protein TadG
MGSSTHKSNGFLGRLGSDQRGNVLAIVAAALIPIAAMIGGGLDLSRAYLAKTRLQQACDAGVLAGRRTMAAGSVMNDTIRGEVRKFVDFNYPANYLGSAAFTALPTIGANDQIDLSLSTSVPTAIMTLFGKDSISVSVSCSARNDYSNIDIVLVLDTTGSMACKASLDADSCNKYYNDHDNQNLLLADGRTVKYATEDTSGGGSRMAALRSALSDLYDQMAIIETRFNTAAESSRKRIRWSVVPFSQMVNAGRGVGSAGTTLYTRKPTWFNVNGSYYNGSRASTTNHNTTWLSNSWNGCVEERGTSNTITASSGHSIPGNLPSTAYDLMFDSAPTSATATRWTVADFDKVGSSQVACPKAMRELAPMTKTEFNDYFSFNSGFVADGATYLDVGMLWAARLLSRTGLWKDDNPTYYHSYPVSRYVIFMTDGEQTESNVGYTAYAEEKYWKRITTNGNATTNKNNHLRRMQMTCTAIKNMDAKIFVISFSAGSTLDTNLSDCSSGPGYAVKADNDAQLMQAFRDIGENIGSLRLSQ